MGVRIEYPCEMCKKPVVLIENTEQLHTVVRGVIRPYQFDEYIGMGVVCANVIQYALVCSMECMKEYDERVG